jgi:multiple sugar transport system permease protein
MERMAIGEQMSGQSAVKKLIKPKTRWNKEFTIALIGILLPLVGWLLFNGFPVVVSFVLLFTKIEGYNLSTLQWNNFANFEQVFTDVRFFKSIGITFWVASAQLISLSIALLISVLLSKTTKGRGVFQVLFFVPYICSTVAVAIMWRWVFDGNHGLLNAVLGTNIHWLNNTENPSTLTWAIIVAIVWQAPGYGIVMFKAALDAVNPAYYEAAEIDGANAFRQFYNITLPSIAPTIFYLLFTGILAGLTTFDSATLMAPISWTQTAGYDDRGLTLLYYAYIIGTQRMEMELASVVSWTLFVVTTVLSVIVMKRRNKAVEE